MTHASSPGYAAHVARLAQAQGERPVIATAGRPPLTCAALAARIDATRRMLASIGIGRGDIVAWSTADRVESAVALATLPGCCAIAPLDPMLGVDAIADRLARLRPAAVVVPSSRGNPIAEAAARVGVARIDLVARSNGPAGDHVLVPRDERTTAPRRRLPDDTVVVIGSSGTTGRPKLVPCTWTALRIASGAVAERLAITSDDVSAHLTPLHYANGVRNAFLLAIFAGASVRVLPEADVDAFLAAVDAGEVTYTTASFTILREVLARLEAGARVRRGRLRFVRVASGAMDDDESDRLERLLGVPVLSGLSTTETGTIALQSLPPAPRRRGSCGERLRARVDVVDEDGRALPPGVTGAIRVRGPQVFTGYLDDDALTALTLADGWFATGDLGSIDEHGELRIAGRRSEVINRGGEKIAPEEIDAVLRSLPEVAQAAAFAIPHPRLGQEVVAAVVAKPGTDLREDDVITRVRTKLGARRAPRRVWIVESLPAAGGGKLARHRLAEWLGAGAGIAEVTAAEPADRSPVEAAIAGLWSAALGVDAIPSDRSFAALGGDEPAARRMRDDVCAAFGVALPGSMDATLESTLGQFARAVEDVLGGPGCRA